MNQTGIGVCKWCGDISGMGAYSGRTARESWAFSLSPPSQPLNSGINPDFRFERTGANLLILSDAFIHAGSDARN